VGSASEKTGLRDVHDLCRFSKGDFIMGRLLVVVLCLALVVGAVGFYLDWWKFNRTTSGGTTDITLTVDKNKIKKDTSNAAEQVRNVGRDVKAQAEQVVGRETVQGKVVSVDADNRTLTVARDKAENVTVHAVDGTTMKRNDQTVTLRDVLPNEPVMVVYVTEAGKHIARTITVETR